jgi:hypothetical protein
MTIVLNEADSDDSDEQAGGGEGGGVAGNGVQMNVLASIIGENIDDTDPGDEDCGVFGNNSLGSNVSTEPDPMGLNDRGCFVNFPTLPPSDTIVGSLDFMGPLQDNGGPTETHAIVETATAQDRHTGTGCSGTDQRGVPRPSGAACDSGAYEYVECGDVTVNVVGTQGKDTLTGTVAGDGILALGGNDTVNAGLGNDKVCGGSGDDRLNGGDDADDLFGEAGDDRLDGGTNLDICVGGSGKDKLFNCEG